MATIAQLEKEFEGGIKQNQQNKKDVSIHHAAGTAPPLGLI